MTKHYYEIKNYANIGTAFDINAYTALIVDLVKGGCEVNPDTAVKVMSNYQVGYTGVHGPTEDRLKAEAEERAAKAAREVEEEEVKEEGVVEDNTETQNEQEQEDVEASKAARDLAEAAGVAINTIGQALGKTKLTKPDVQEYIDSKQ